MASQRALPAIAVEQVGEDAPGGGPALLRCLAHEPCLARLPVALGGEAAEGAVLATFRPGYAMLRVVVRDAAGRLREFAPLGSATGLQVALAGEGARVVALWEATPGGGPVLAGADGPGAPLHLRVALLPPER